MNEVRKEAREPISGSVLLNKFSPVGVSDTAIEYSPPGKRKVFVLNAGREVTWGCVVNGGKEGVVECPWTLVRPEQWEKFR